MDSGTFLQFTAPNSSPLLAGSSLDITLSGDEDLDVELFDNGETLFSGTTGAGLLTLAGALGEGEHTLTAVGTDFAGNSVSVSTSPEVVLVDTLGPTVSLNAPASGNTFRQG